MVQMFYYENHGQACRKILNHEGSPSKIFLFADEGYAKTAPTAHWILKRPWWSRTFCKITEITATRRISARAKIVDLGRGNMCIKGRFKEVEDPDFRMHLTTHVTSADFKQGYSMTGTLERGNKKKGDLHLTHFAMLKRKDYLKDDNNNK
ncbi:uncharacterized protein TNCT_599461 [Trichonephila clavata]|uniref:Uncharacterized protein n=1 Tax=Trichonephila clavata TaxID=2740835 RepID=A0A8X6FPP8_TRICU|nr:uncharacterized protein TNCT_599461 [Trichonephila clavata]